MRSNPNPKSKPLTEFACSTQLAWVSEWIRWAMDELEEFVERTPYRDTFDRVNRAIARLILALQHVAAATSEIGNSVWHLRTAKNLVEQAYAVIDSGYFEEVADLHEVLDLIDLASRKLQRVIELRER